MADNFRDVANIAVVSGAFGLGIGAAGAVVQQRGGWGGVGRGAFAGRSDPGPERGERALPERLDPGRKRPP